MVRFQTYEFADIVGGCENVLGMLKAHFDESGIHRDAQACVVR
jgi:hypothetical protein